MTPWLHTPIIHIHTPTVAGGDTMSSITEKARVEAEKSWPPNVSNGLRRADNAISRETFVAGAEFGYAERAAESLSVEQVADIIDQHTTASGAYRSCGLVYTCRCGHETRPVVTVEGDPEGSIACDRVLSARARKLHAVHVAAMIHAGGER